MSWYYRKQGQTHGPFSKADLDALVQNGEINPETYIWQKGMPEWKHYREVHEMPPAGPSPAPNDANATQSQSTAAAPADIQAADASSVEVPSDIKNGFFYLLNNQTCGPVDQSELDAMVAAGTLAPETFVFKEGMSDWMPYTALKEAAKAETSTQQAPAPAETKAYSGGLRIKITQPAHPAQAQAQSTEAQAGAAAQGIEDGVCMNCGAVMPVTQLRHVGQGYVCPACQNRVGVKRHASGLLSSFWTGNPAERIRHIVYALILLGGLIAGAIYLISAFK